MILPALPSDIPPQIQELIEWLQRSAAWIGIIYLMIAALNAFVLFGATKLLRLQNHTITTVAAVAAMLPCQCCCCFGLPFGIWALVVMNKPEVKSQFI